MVAVFPNESQRGELLIYLKGCLVPNPSCSSLFEVLGFPSILCWYLSTTALPLALFILRLHLVVWQIMLVIPVVGGEFSAHV
jgi:hypothetical protein